jgi:exosome complex RNA-binding protein Csl4
MLSLVQVRFAKSQAGDVLMAPLSWMEMQCPKTKTVEARKVAKPTNVA